MTSFDISFENTMKHEGDYSNDSVDKGKETYRGISRVYHPNWDGWDIIDALKGKTFPNNLTSSLDLKNKVKVFYKKNYWDKIYGDQLKYQFVANEMFDSAVNLGVKRAGLFFQQALNFLNRDGKIFKDVVIDGIIGNKTIYAYNLLSLDDIKVAVKILNILQGDHYLTYMIKDPTQEKFCRGWLERVNLN